MIIITKRSPVALVGGRYIYHIDSTQMISIPGPGTKVDRKVDEARWVSLFLALLLMDIILTPSLWWTDTCKSLIKWIWAKTFISATHMMWLKRSRAIWRVNRGFRKCTCGRFWVSSSFITRTDLRHRWNRFLLSPVSEQLSSDWILPIIHGFVDQASTYHQFVWKIELWGLINGGIEISIYGQNVFVTLIARRSRYFAGARFLKRGVNDQVCTTPSQTTNR